MQFDQTDLRLFVAAAELGNLTRAAERQHMSLAAASARIKALEIECQVPLFSREARGVKLLPSGEALLHHARLILAQAEQLRNELREYGGGLRGHLRVFANTTAVMDFLPEILPDFLNRNRQINVDLQEKPNAHIPRGVLDGRADIGIVAGQVDTLGLDVIHFSTDRLVLVTSRKHPFAKRRRIAFVETLDEDAIAMQQGSTLQAFLSQVTEGLGKHQRLRVQLGNFDAMCRMIGSGVGIGVVPESAARRNQEGMQLALIELTDPWCVRERYLLVRDRRTLPSYAEELVQTLCDYFASRP
ncbi:LysR substrate-binding domain-containing protein [Variovorax saccharolyticus]|uniref:LysR substrate-binding domain-containing protein n=1 Tax=Variovorax saccharolyticus TaxID=3053516 RepID=UPI0025762C94|nr:LysR substrate-binding domain-containing protein [Variovorax sp. J31P216]MDM0023960.1 LysR substrate-binding domain-containing protein [Variovorax sp. J31P216]